MSSDHLPRAKTLQSRWVYSGRFLKIELLDLELPNGTQTSLEVIRHPGAAAVLPLRPDGTAVLIRQYREAAGGWILEVPAGKLDAGETPDTCALREVEEEVGLRAERLFPLGPIHTTPGFTDEVIWLYVAQGLSPVPVRREVDEVMEVVEMPLAEAIGLIPTGAITDSKSLLCLLRAEQELRAGRLHLA